jgi:LysR family carnitine catabolism transcriptional activator
MHLTVRQLEILIAAADAATFSEAARNLGISQPSLSEAVRRMESEIGATLFDRNTRSVTLSADGRHTVAIAREVVREFRLGLESIADRSRTRRARVTVAALPSIACAVLPTAMQRLLRDHPSTEIALHDVLHERAIGLVTDGVADLALTVRPASLDGLDFIELGADVLHLVCRRDHALASKRRLVWRDLAGQPFVALARTSSVRRLTDAAFVHAGVTIEPTYETEQIPSAAALVEAGLGVTALPGLTLAMIKGAALAVRPLGSPLMRRQIGIATLAGRARSAAVTSLIVQMERCFARAQDQRRSVATVGPPRR